MRQGRGIGAGGSLAFVCAAIVPFSGLAVAAPADAAKAPKCGSQHATIVGTAGSDILHGTPRPDVIAALAGADRVSNVGARDRVCTGDGGDVVQGRVMPRRKTGVGHHRPRRDWPGRGGLGDLVLGDGADELIVTCPAGSPYPPGAFNRIAGGDGDDDISSNCPFRDTVFGGPGNDTITVGLGHDYASGGGGDDHITDAFSVPGDCTLTRPEQYLEVNGVPFRDCFTSGAGTEFWEDIFDGGDGDDVIDGGAANDLITGGAGLDLLSGGDGSDAISGGENRDTCDGGEGPGDLNGDQFGRPLADCEVGSNFELAGFFPGAKPPVANCSRDLFPETADLVSCYEARPRLMTLDWTPPRLDVTESSDAIDVYMWVIPTRETLNPEPLLSSVRVEASSTSGEQRTADAPCPSVRMQMPIICDVKLAFPQGTPNNTWKLDAVTLLDDVGGYSVYTAADIQDRDVLPIAGYDTRSTKVYGQGPSPIPKLTSLTVAPRTVDTSTGDSSFEVQFDATDDVRVDQADVYIKRPGDTLWQSTRTPIYPASRSGTAAHFRTTVDVPSDSPKGNWKLRVMLEDNYEHTFFDDARLTSLGFPSSIEHIGGG